MAETRNIVKIFLASPGDMAAERQAAKTVVDEFNLTWANALGYQIDLIGWEDTVSTYGRPQATINRDLEQCEYFFGMMWRKWGTPPDTEGTYTSGFEEEFRRSAERHEKSGLPRISLVFKSIDNELLKDPGDELKKVLAFKQELIASKKVLFDNFTDVREFESKFRRCISQYIALLRESQTKQSPQQTEFVPQKDEPPHIEASSDSDQTPFTAEGRQFLRRLVTQAHDDVERPSLLAVDVARFRLLSVFISEQGNDELTLGVHDANLLFIDRMSIELSDGERRTLLRTGLQRFSDENVPLWFWVAQVGGLHAGTLQYFSIGSNTRQCRGALEAMRLIGEPLAIDEVLDRGFYVSQWLGESKIAKTKVAALDYLRDWGLVADLPAIRAEFDRNDTQTARAAAEAIVLIQYRDGRDRAVSALLELPISGVSLAVVNELFYDTKGISEELLVAALSHPSVDVRRAAAASLRKRRELSQEVGERLFADADAQVSLEALLALAEKGRDFKDDDVRAILSKKAPSGLFLSSVGTRTELADKQYASFRESKTRMKTDAQLKESQRFTDDAGFFDHSADLELARRSFRKYKKWLRDRLNDRFKSDFDAHVATVAGRYGDLAESYVKAEEPLRKQMCRTALDVIARKGDESDVPRLREMLESSFVSVSIEDFAFLADFGQWRDIPMIIRLSTGPSSLGYLLSSLTDTTLLRPAAKAIIKLAKGRLEEMLRLSIPANLLKEVVQRFSTGEIRSLTEDSIMSLLQSDTDAVRKATALQIVRSFPKVQLRRFFDAKNAAGELRFYNVVHWLDFGLSIPHARAVAGAKRVLSRLED